MQNGLIEQYKAAYEKKTETPLKKLIRKALQNKLFAFRIDPKMYSRTDFIRSSFTIVLLQVAIW